METKQKFEVLAVPGKRAFIVSQEHSDAFKNAKTDQEIRKEIEEMSQRFRINNLRDKGPVLQRKIK